MAALIDCEKCGIGVGGSKKRQNKRLLGWPLIKFNSESL
jgi:hypothetical protein